MIRYIMQKSVYDELAKCGIIEKGQRTVIVPPSNGRKGYQYVRNYPDKEIKFTNKDKAEVIEKIENPTKSIKRIEYTRENYNKLFPRGIAHSPIGDIKLGEHQFERLSIKDSGARKSFLGLLYQTLKNPVVILHKIDAKGRSAKLFINSVKDKNGKKCYLVVVPKIDGIDVAVSNGPRDEKAILKEINKADKFYYKAESTGLKTSRLHKTNAVGGSQISGTFNESPAQGIDSVQQD